MKTLSTIVVLVALAGCGVPEGPCGPPTSIQSGSYSLSAQTERWPEGTVATIDREEGTVEVVYTNEDGAQVVESYIIRELSQ